MAAPMANVYKESAKGPMAWPARMMLGTAEMIIVTCAMPQIATPIQIVLKRPRCASASHPPKIGLRKLSVTSTKYSLELKIQSVGQECKGISHGRSDNCSLAKSTSGSLASPWLGSSTVSTLWKRSPIKFLKTCLHP